MTPAVDTVEALDEARAREMFASAFAEYPPNERGEIPQWDDADVSVWMIRDQLMRFARAIRQADERAGLATVPHEPTKRMIDAMDSTPSEMPWSRLFVNAVSASPFVAAQGEGGG